MTSIEEQTAEEITLSLTYAGFILFAYELVKSMIIKPIKAFYQDITFGKGMPFKSYEEDVMSRHKNQFEACLLYLRDFMEALDSEDVLTIQALRKHRNDLAHGLPSMLGSLDVEEYIPLLEKTDKTLFKLSNYRTYMGIGADPKFQNKGIDWNTIKGSEYLLFEDILSKVKVFRGHRKCRITRHSTGRKFSCASFAPVSLVVGHHGQSHIGRKGGAS